MGSRAFTCRARPRTHLQDARLVRALGHAHVTIGNGGGRHDLHGMAWYGTAQHDSSAALVHSTFPLLTCPMMLQGNTSSHCRHLASCLCNDGSTTPPFAHPAWAGIPVPTCPATHQLHGQVSQPAEDEGGAGAQLDCNTTEQPQQAGEGRGTAGKLSISRWHTMGEDS